MAGINKYKLYLHSVLKKHKAEWVPEYKFCKTRKFRFDYANLENKIAIEYEGIYGGRKSRHTSLIGYSNDTQKYNLAVLEGWRVLRYTAKTIQNLEKDLKELGIY